MKLRNKKTGGLANCEPIEVRTDAGFHDYYSLAELNEGWEDYEPKEPLIDDEDARDAVYSWASKLQIHQVKCKIGMRGLGVVVTTFQACSLNSAPIIEFTSLYANVVHGGTYTVDELCGDEEAPEPIEPMFVDLDERVKEKGEE